MSRLGRHRLPAVLTLLFLALFTLGGCSSSGSSTQSQQQAAKQSFDKIDQHAAKLKAPELINDVEYKNYIRAQKLYDTPTTIIWCTTTWGNNSSPLVTVPIAGKLTSSSVSLRPSQQMRIDNDTGSTTYTPEVRSVDSMYHGTPPPYRYGFTPGGQYVDFSGMPTVCTTALTKFQRQTTKVSVAVDDKMKAAQAQAEAALKQGKPGEAQRILQDALGGGE